MNQYKYFVLVKRANESSRSTQESNRLCNVGVSAEIIRTHYSAMTFVVLQEQTGRPQSPDAHATAPGQAECLLVATASAAASATVAATA
ncbi:MAG TPA: hypothetical protein DD473_04270 [Planctomycetaceae bacterium]|nr:hypothetical protein [Planctomycetaceae bacterium]